MENVFIAPITDYSFGITSFTWYELPSYKLFTEELEHLLEKNLDMSNYGNGIKKIVVSFIAYPVGLSHLAEAKEEKEFVKEMKLASISISMNYEQLMRDSDKQAFKRVKTSYFEGIKKMLPTLKIKDFDVNQFIIDLKKVLNN